MFELLMLLIMPSEINPQELGIKYLLKDKFVDYQSCEEYVKKKTVKNLNIYSLISLSQGFLDWYSKFYHLDAKYSHPGKICP